jgi:hypothetical protein
MRIQRRHVSRTILVALCCIGVLYLWVISHDPRHLDDFLTYWTAGRLNAQGVNPYDADRVLELQRSVGWTKRFGYRIWYPPWTIGLLMPLGSMPESAGRFVWYLLSIAAVVVCADWLWRAYGGDPSKRGVAWLVAAAFAPVAIVWKTGQISPIMLVGVVGFLAGMRADRPFRAGACLALAAAKPQLAYLVWPALALDVLRTRDVRPVVSLAITMGILLGAASIANPDVLAQFVAVNRNEPPHITMAPYVLPSAPGTALRWAAVRLTGTDVPTLQFVPVIAGLVWVLVYWRRRGDDWSWLEDMPYVLLVSFATTSWCWVYDEPLLLVPLIHAAVVLAGRRPWRRSEGLLVVAYVATNVAILAADVAAVQASSYVWTQYVFFALYLVLVRAPATFAAAASSGVGAAGSGRASR